MSLSGKGRGTGPGEVVTCLRSHSKPGVLAPTSLPPVPPSALRVFLSRHRGAGEKRQERALLLLVRSFIFALLISSIGFSRRREGGMEGGLGPHWRTEKRKRTKGLGGEGEGNFRIKH